MLDEAPQGGTISRMEPRFRQLYKERHRLLISNLGHPVALIILAVGVAGASSILRFTLKQDVAAMLAGLAYTLVAPFVFAVGAWIRCTRTDRADGDSPKVSTPRSDI